MNKVILADNQAIFRAGTAKILAMEDDFRIIAQCGDAERLHQTVETFRGAVFLFASTLKLNLPLFLERVRAHGSRAIAIVENTETTPPFIAAGAHGALHRCVSGPALIECVRRVNRGEQGIQGTVPGLLPHEDDLVGARVRDRLTPKEMKIVALIVQGCKNKEIAMRLTTTEQVIKNYLRSIYDKTGVSDRLELALFTIHHRILAEAAAAAGDVIMQAN
ncbi:response regulator transcription factor [Silvibacterium sp.]|uniref:response regulator transcription factor n=1 Tax=Silvibacterium sp. TaxID=1964179 RepID=UPI0039E28FEA